VVGAGSLLFHWSNPNLNYRWTLVARDLNFLSAVLDLALWMTLIANRKRDRYLLMLSGGLGLQFSGEALGQSIRDIAMRSHSKPLSLAGTCLVVISNLICLYVWWQTFRQYNQAQNRKKPVAEETATGGTQG